MSWGLGSSAKDTGVFMLPSRTYQNMSNVAQEINSYENSAVIGSPRISVIVAVLTGVEYLNRCIESVAGQTHGVYELVIIDGGSTDGTVDILRSSKRMIDHRLSEPDSGMSDAWNKGTARATGDWLCSPGANDYWIASTILAHASSRLKEFVPRYVVDVEK